MDNTKINFKRRDNIFQILNSQKKTFGKKHIKKNNTIEKKKKIKQKNQLKII